MSDIFVYDNESAITSKFYQTIKRFYPNFESQAFQKKWIVAIPISRSYDEDKLTKQYINAHIFQPSSFYLGQYVSLTGKQAEIKSDFLLISKNVENDSNLQVERSCRILEDNEVYNEHLSSQSYRILLIDKPVEGSYHAIVPSQTGIAALHRKSIDEIISYLTNDPKSSSIMISLKRDLYYIKNGYKVDSEVDCIDALSNRIQQIINRHYFLLIDINSAWACCKQSHEKEMILRCCLETYIMEDLYTFIFPLIKQKYSQDDQILTSFLYYKRMKGGFTREELSIKPMLFHSKQLKQSSQILNKLNTSGCVLHKLRIIWECMRDINNSISNTIQAVYNQQVDLAADDIVPMMVYVIEESDVHDLLATSEYIMKFDFSNLKDRDLGFCFVTFQVAVTYLQEKAKEWNDQKQQSIFPSTSSSSTSLQRFITPVQQTMLQRENEANQSRLRRGTIAFNPKQLTYRNEQSFQSSQSIQSDSVFGHLLIRDYLHDDTVSPEIVHSNQKEEEDTSSSTETTYWWNSKLHKKRQFTLPWNYSISSSSQSTSPQPEKAKVANSPRHSILQSRTSQKGSSFHYPSESQQIEKKPKEVVKKRRYFCCCGSDDEMNEENCAHEVNDVVFTTAAGSSNITTEGIEEEEENSTKMIIDKPVKRPSTQSTRSGFSSSLPIPMKPSSNEERLSRSQPITNTNSYKQEDIRQSALSMDRGMGSFIQDLKRSQGSCVSSRSWNLSD